MHTKRGGTRGPSANQLLKVKKTKKHNVEPKPKIYNKADYDPSYDSATRHTAEIIFAHNAHTHVHTHASLHGRKTHNGHSSLCSTRKAGNHFLTDTNTKKKL